MLCSGVLRERFAMAQLGLDEKYAADTCVSRNSRVRGMSRMDLAPAQITATGVRPSSVKSADTSIVVSAPLCTPPIPVHSR